MFTKVGHLLARHHCHYRFHIAALILLSTFYLLWNQIQLAGLGIVEEDLYDSLYYESLPKVPVEGLNLLWTFS